MKLLVGQFLDLLVFVPVSEGLQNWHGSHDEIEVLDHRAVDEDDGEGIIEVNLRKELDLLQVDLVPMQAGH